MRVYIMGPMSGLPDCNRPAFFRAEEFLMSHGHYTVNPARCDVQEPYSTWVDCILWDIRLLSTCQAVYRLRGWENSPGATIENIVAKRLNLKVWDEEMCPVCVKKKARKQQRKGKI